MTLAGRMMWVEHEPCSISADTVMSLLKRLGWHEAADLIERIGERSAEQNREADRWRRAYEELRQKYEPAAAPAERISYRPDWTCDG